MRLIVYAGGTFDCFHVGHVRFLQKCSHIGDVVVGLNSDEFAERYKRRPVMFYEERAEILNSCRHVSGVIPNEGDEDSRPAILKSRAQFVAHGDDWSGPSLMRQMGLTSEWLHEHGISVLTIPYTDGVSTTDIIGRLSG